jgi:hypothetical protein
MKNDQQIAVTVQVRAEEADRRITWPAIKVTRIWPDLAEADRPAMHYFSLHVDQKRLRA